MRVGSICFHFKLALQYMFNFNFIVLILLVSVACVKAKKDTKAEKAPPEAPQKGLYYESVGEGEPLIFLHGVWMSSQFFKLQQDYFGKKYAYYALDFKGHGRSTDDGTGHTIAAYAKDLKDFIANKGLQNVNLVGWSMGSFVIWEYLKTFGTSNLKTVTIVDQGPTDLQNEAWQMAPLPFASLAHFMELVQTDQLAAVQALVPLMFKDTLASEELDWMVKEGLKMNPASASAILFNQTAVDYRADLKSFSIPALLIFGRDEKLLKVSNGEYINEQMPNSELVIFENSGQIGRAHV